jgi:drug/metabolite transporter (DMT)-like permease
MQKNVNKYKIYLGVLTLGIIWGSTWLAIKSGLQDASPFFSAAVAKKYNYKIKF